MLKLTEVTVLFWGCCDLWVVLIIACCYLTFFFFYTASNASAPPPVQAPIQGKNASSELIFADFISDATMLCGTYVLADAWSEINTNMYMYTVSQRPGRPFCALRAFQKKSAYCPLYSFHAIDMFAMFGWLPTALTPGHAVLYNATEQDTAFTELVRTRLVDEFAWEGAVVSWKKYGGHDRRVEVLNVVEGRTLEGWREQQCRLFLKHGYYLTKAWIN